MAKTMTPQEQFRNDYYSNLEVIYWFNKVKTCHARYKKTDNEEIKSECVIDIYSIYIQLIEILFTNINVAGATANTFLPNFFISNTKLQEFIRSFESSESNLREVFLNERIKPIIDFVIKDTNKAENVLSQYGILFKEVIGDYMKDFEMLNAYKHGFRVNFKTKKSEHGISNGKENYRVGSTDAQITYYSKGKGEDIVYDHLISFNIERIFGKAKFTYTLLENIVARGKQIAEPDRAFYYRCMEIDLNSDEWKNNSYSIRYKTQFASFTDIEPTTG